MRFYLNWLFRMILTIAPEVSSRLLLSNSFLHQILYHWIESHLQRLLFYSVKQLVSTIDVQAPFLQGRGVSRKSHQFGKNFFSKNAIKIDFEKLGCKILRKLLKKNAIKRVSRKIFQIRETKRNFAPIVSMFLGTQWTIAHLCFADIFGIASFFS